MIDTSYHRVKEHPVPQHLSLFKKSKVCEEGSQMNGTMLIIATNMLIQLPRSVCLMLHVECSVWYLVRWCDGILVSVCVYTLLNVRNRIWKASTHMNDQQPVGVTRKLRTSWRISRNRSSRPFALHAVCGPVSLTDGDSPDLLSAKGVPSRAGLSLQMLHCECCL